MHMTCKGKRYACKYVLVASHHALFKTVPINYQIHKVTNCQLAIIYFVTEKKKRFKIPELSTVEQTNIHVLHT